MRNVLKNNTDVFKVGDVVRMVLDHEVHTISYGFNGSTPKVVFTGLPENEFSPAILIYSNKARVRLQKVEVRCVSFCPCGCNK